MRQRRGFPDVSSNTDNQSHGKRRSPHESARHVSTIDCTLQSSARLIRRKSTRKNQNSLTIVAWAPQQALGSQLW